MSLYQKALPSLPTFPDVEQQNHELRLKVKSLEGVIENLYQQLLFYMNLRDQRVQLEKDLKEQIKRSKEVLNSLAWRQMKIRDYEAQMSEQWSEYLDSSSEERHSATWECLEDIKMRIMDNGLGDI